MRGTIPALPLLVLLTTGAPVVATEPELRPLPEVSVAAMEPAVRQQLEAQRRELNREAARFDGANDASRRDLAAAFAALGRLYTLYDLSEAAIVALENALALRPESGSGSDDATRYLLGSVLALEGRLDDAATQLEALVGGDTALAGAARVRLADLEIRRGGLDAAEALLLEARELDGFAAAADFGLGRVAFERGELREAGERFAAVLAAQPSANVVHYHLGQVFRELGEAERARFHFENRGERGVLHPDPVADELRGEITGVGALLQLGRIARQRGDREAARARFEEALRLDPESPAALRSLANLSLDAGDLGAALELFERAIDAAPDDAAMRYYVARLLVERPTPPAANAAEAEALRAEWTARAVEHLRAAVRLAPDSLPARAELAARLAALGRTGEAIEQLELALRHHPTTAVRAELAQLYAAAGRYADAAAQHREIAEEEPENHRARFSEALALALDSQYQRARTRLEVALERFPGVPVYAQLLTQLLVAAPDQAARDERVGLDLAQRLFAALPTTENGELVAMALAATGDSETAAAWQQRVLTELESGDPDPLVLTRARARLERYRAGDRVWSPWR